MSARAAPWSLRRTLLAWLLGLTLALWGLSALIVYLEAEREIARQQPATLTSLRAISGVGDKKLESYGAEIVALIAEMS